MPKAKAGQIKIYYETHGNGDPLILISGFTADHYAWAPVQDTFAKNFQVITFDARGVGQSTIPQEPFTTGVMADDLLALMDHLKLTQANILGHSMEGAVAIEFAVAHPDRVKKLIVSNSLSLERRRFFYFAEGAFRLLEQGVAPYMIFDLFIPWLFSEQFLKDNPDRILDIRSSTQNNPHPITLNGFKGQLEALKSMDISQLLTKIQALTLMIASEQDFITPKEQIQDLSSQIPNVQIEVFPGGHLPQVEVEVQFVEKVVSFLQGL